MAAGLGSPVVIAKRVSASITRCDAACEIPNNGPIWRIVRFCPPIRRDQHHPISQRQRPLPTLPTIRDCLPTPLGYHPDSLRSGPGFDRSYRRRDRLYVDNGYVTTIRRRLG